MYVVGEEKESSGYVQEGREDRRRVRVSDTRVNPTLLLRVSGRNKEPNRARANLNWSASGIRIELGIAYVVLVDYRPIISYLDRSTDAWK